MHLTAQEKQALIGPLVVGIVLGALVAYAVFAFASEYALQGHPSSIWRTAVEASIGFLVSVLGTVGTLGALPIAIQRLRTRSNSGSN
jgi:hypothetical protein